MSRMAELHAICQEYGINTDDPLALDIALRIEQILDHPTTRDHVAILVREIGYRIRHRAWYALDCPPSMAPGYWPTIAKVQVRRMGWAVEEHLSPRATKLAGAVLALGMAAWWSAPAWTAPQDVAPVWAPAIAVACQSDDGASATYPCYWDASVQGNGAGESFWLASFDGTQYGPDDCETLTVEDGYVYCDG